jgi:hypothetical protein
MDADIHCLEMDADILCLGMDADIHCLEMDMDILCLEMDADIHRWDGYHTTDYYYQQTRYLCAPHTPSCCSYSLYFT